MGELRDAIETIADIKSEFADVGVYSTKRSISSAAMEGTASFPVLLEDTISLDDGILVARGAEKKYASFLTTVLTMDPYLEVSKGQTPTASAYLRQFHQNTRVKSADKLIPNLSLNEFISESYHENDMEYTTLESEAYKMATCIYEGVLKSIPQDRHVLLNYSVEEVVSEGTLNDRFAVLNPLLEAKKDQTVYLDTQGGDVRFEKAPGAIISKGAIQNNTTVTVGDLGKTPKPTPNRGGQWKTLTDNDCKKANDLVPTLLHIRVYPIDKYTREELTPIDFIMGVKATLHPLPIAEISRMVVCGMRNENFMFNFIRWRTGEISVYKDFLFAIDTIKMDAADSGKDVTGWRPALKRRRRLAKSKIHFTKKSVMPNATLVVSNSGIAYIKDTYGYDLSNESIVRRLMDVYFLLGCVELDMVKQRASFRFDGIESPEVYTLDSLRKENQNDDKAFKSMMKLVGRSL